MARPRLLLLAACSALLLGLCIQETSAWGSPAPPSESECRPYIEKALKEKEQHETAEAAESQEDGGTDAAESGEQADQATSEEVVDTTAGIEENSVESKEGDSAEQAGAGADESSEAGPTQDQESAEGQDEQESDDGASVEDGDDHPDDGEDASTEAGDEAASTEDDADSKDGDSKEDGDTEEVTSGEAEVASGERDGDEGAASAEDKDDSDEAQTKEESGEDQAQADSKEDENDSQEAEATLTARSAEEVDAAAESGEDHKSGEEDDKSGDEEDAKSGEDDVKSGEDEAKSGEEDAKSGEDDSKSGEDEAKSGEEDAESVEEDEKSGEDAKSGEEEAKSDEDEGKSAEDDAKSGEDEGKSGEDDGKSAEDDAKSAEDDGKSGEDDAKSGEEDTAKSGEDDDKGEEDGKSAEDDAKSGEDDAKSAEDDEQGDEAASDEEESPEEELTMEIEIPENLRPRDHIAQILKLDESSAETEELLQKSVDITLRELKRLYDTAIKPLEMLYKYRDLSNRHFGDPEIFSKPLILFMGPWSGGKSTIINYLLDNEYKPLSLRTGAEPSPAYFNILMHGEREEILDGTQLAADWTFSGLQKFGQGLLDRLRGVRLNSPLLEKVNIVEIPGILEIRKQVERMFPFNDACQWFIDRADIIFLVYDPSKLDVGPETEAILDQLKGREYQTRIILNKADQVKPEELMRVQGTLIWNISPLMSSAEPPIMYSTSLWSMPYESGAPVRLLQAQEHAFLRDLREAVTKRVDNKIASARRFAVRVRNHAKMVDCYLTTYYNHKTFFGNKKKTADDIIERPQEYHIYEGLSTLTNISRYDLPDPETYRDFFKLNPLFEFQQLSATCTYFRGCPINRLDVAIAYDLPDLVGKYKKNVEETMEQIHKTQPKS